MIDGKKLRELRKLMGMTQQDVAGYVSMDVNELDKYENGEDVGDITKLQIMRFIDAVRRAVDEHDRKEKENV